MRESRREERHLVGTVGTKKFLNSSLAYRSPKRTRETVQRRIVHNNPFGINPLTNKPYLTMDITTYGHRSRNWLNI